MARKKKNRNRVENDYSRQSFIGADFSNLDLDDADFSNCSLTGVDFSNTDLAKSNFQGASITGSDFSNANLCGSDFHNSSLAGCNFTNSDVDGAKFNGASITGCDFMNADVEQATGLEFLIETTNNDQSSRNLTSVSITDTRQYVDHIYGGDFSVQKGAFSNGGNIVAVGVSVGNHESMNIRSVDGASIAELGWVRVRSNGGGFGVSSFGGFRSSRGQHLDTRVAEISTGKGHLRIEVIGAGRLIIM